ncbi:hypothetical protein LINGRAHAP2_LOCUS11697 [Linum grandiflorum]
MKTQSAVDRISELPDEIINLIVRSLPSHEEVARTSILSRRWLKLWLSNSYPVVEFHGRRFQRFAAATFKRLQAVPLLLDSFTISLHRSTNVGRELYQLLLSASIGADEYGDRSPLKVVLINDYWIRDFLEGGMLLTCGRTKFLHLECFDLSGLHDFKTCLDNLQELCLEHVSVSQQSFPSCLANARRLEKLSLKSIFGIKTLDVSASNFPSLIYLSFQSNDSPRDREQLQRLQLSSAPLLQTFCFRGDSGSLRVVSAPNVTSFELAPNAKLRRRELDELISKFPSLSLLSLDFDERYINRSHTLRELTLKQQERRIKFEYEIDAPNLVTLFIRSNELPINVDILNVSSSTCQCVVDCSISEAQKSTDWSLDLRDYLATLATQFRHLVFNLNFPRKGFSKVLELDSNKVIWQSSPVAVQHFKLGVDFLRLESAFKTADDQTRLFDGILSSINPKTVFVAQPGENRSLSWVSLQLLVLAYRFLLLA